jgi:hypothetical protein
MNSKVGQNIDFMENKASSKQPDREWESAIRKQKAHFNKLDWFLVVHDQVQSKEVAEVTEVSDKIVPATAIVVSVSDNQHA